MNLFSSAEIGTERFDGQSNYDGQPLQAQWYLAAFKETKGDTRSQGAAHVIAHTLETTGKYTPGRWLYVDLCYKGGSEGYMNLGKKVAGSIADATGVAVEQFSTTGNELKGKIVAVRVTVQPEEKDEATGEVTKKARNNVAGIMPASQIETLRAEHDAKFGTSAAPAASKPATQKPAAAPVDHSTPAAFAAQTPAQAPAAAPAQAAPAAFAQQPWTGAPAADAAPVAPPVAAAAPAVTPVPTWESEGYIQHPGSEPHCYKGQDVKVKADFNAELAAAHAAAQAPVAAPAVPTAPDVPAVAAAPAAGAPPWAGGVPVAQ